MADEIRATPRNQLLGLLADTLQGGANFAAKPFGYDNPPVRGLLELMGVPALTNTLNELSYGGALGAGSGMTYRPKADTLDAAMAVTPLLGGMPRAINAGAAAIGQRLEPSVNALVNRTMVQGGRPAQLLQDMAQGTVSPMTVWHGSPHRFDRFDASKIGTGEGAQAYGHGIYTAEAKDVAKSYADELGELQMLHNGRQVGVFDKDPAANAAHQIRATNGDIQKAIRRAQMLYTGGWRDSVVGEIQRLGPGEISEQLIGNLYKVDLPDEHVARMLDWDRPFSQQAPEVKKALQDAGVVGKDDWLISGMRGREIYNRASFGAPVKLPLNQADDQIFAAERLRTAGIPGIRYLDGGSRGAGQGTSNFVVFPGNENILTILERNGQPVNAMRSLLD